jgi:hypothetical protein
MPDPGFLTAKIMAGLGGLIGGLALMSYIKPRSILDATLRGGISTGTGIIFSPPLVEWFDATPTMDVYLMFGFVIGFLSWGVLSLIARVFSNAEKNKEDIIDVVNRGRSGDKNGE